MEQIPSFNALIEKSIIDNWDLDSLTDYKGKTLQYHDVARKIEKLHIMFEASGVQRGDKIALCGRNSAAWAAAFLAILTYGAVAVPILHEFTPDQVHNIVNHSDAKLLFIGDVAATQIDATKMPGLEGIIYIPDYSLVVSRTEQLTYAREHLNEMFGKKYPKYFRQQHVHYYREQSPDELALINYTSGTTGRSKGVMLPYRSLWSNADFAFHVLGKTLKRGDNVISILPMAHMYGMAFEFIFEFLKGMHIYYLNRVPSPAVIAQALADVKPRIMIAVPLVIEKIIRKKVFPKLQTNKMRLLMAMPVISKKVRAAILAQVSKAFGGNLYEVIIGGAALNGEVEAFLRKIGFPYTVGYGATECGPIICYRDWQTFAQGSCGQAASTRRCASTAATLPTCRARSSPRVPTSCWATTRIPRPPRRQSTPRDGSTRATSARWTPTAMSISTADPRTCSSDPMARTSIPRRSRTSSTRCPSSARASSCSGATSSWAWSIPTTTRRSSWASTTKTSRA